MKRKMKYINKITNILMLASLSVTFEILIGKKLLKKNRKKTNASFITFFDIFELLLDTHAPLKKLSCSEVKFYLKPWITPGIRKSMKVKDRLQKKFQRVKDPIQKDALSNEVKQYQNLTRNSKANHYQKFFRDHTKNLHKT